MRCDDSNNVYISIELEKKLIHAKDFRFIVNKFNVLYL